MQDLILTMYLGISYKSLEVDKKQKQGETVKEQI